MTPMETDPAGARGRAVVTLVNCLRGDDETETGRFMEAASTLGLNAADLEEIYDGVLPARTVRLPLLGRIA